MLHMGHWAIASCIVLLSLAVILPLPLSDAIRSPGVSHPAISSPNICGEDVCATPMSNEEKIQQYLESLTIQDSQQNTSLDVDAVIAEIAELSQRLQALQNMITGVQQTGLIVDEGIESITKGEEGTAFGFGGTVGLIQTEDIAKHAIITPKIAPGAIVSGKIAPGAIVSGKIAPGAIVSGKIADNAVTTEKIADGTISVADLNWITKLKFGQCSIHIGSESPGGFANGRCDPGAIVSSDQIIATMNNGHPCLALTEVSTSNIGMLFTVVNSCNTSTPETEIEISYMVFR